MRGQLLRARRCAVRGQVAWAGADQAAKSADPDRAERRIRHPADPQPDIDAFLHQAHHPVEQEQAGADLGVLVQEAQQHRQQVQAAEHHGCRHREQPLRARPLARGRALDRLDLGQHTPAALELPQARIGQGDGAGGAVQEARAQAAFESADRTGHRRRRTSQPARGSDEAGLVRDGDEGGYGVQPVHPDCSDLCNRVREFALIPASAATTYMRSADPTNGERP